MFSLVSQQQNFENDAIRDRQPIEISENGNDIFMASGTNLAALFWIRWTGAMSDSGNPYKRLLLQSIREITKACTRGSIQS